MKRICRPCTPPAALISSKRMRAPLTMPTPQMATGPVRSAWVPNTTSLSVTPSTSAAGVSPPGADGSAGPQPDTDRNAARAKGVAKGLIGIPPTCARPPVVT